MSPEAELWEPSQIDTLNATNAYFGYVAGLMLLHDPDSDIRSLVASVDLRSESGRLEVVVHAETLMWDGLANLVRFANRPEVRGKSKEVEPLYPEVIPRLQKIVSDVYKDDDAKHRLEQLHCMLPVFQPLPLVDEHIYKYIVHPRREKLRTVDLMGVFTVASVFRNVVEDRAMAGTKIRRRCSEGSAYSEDAHTASN